MADLFFPPMTPVTPTQEGLFGLRGSDGYSLIGVTDDDDPTLAWVRSLPSPRITNLDITSEDRFLNQNAPNHDERFLETPCPIYDLYTG
uniref:Uncharacterized protein n=1 Tax=Ciona savignyi TaxID=51511 RepID=H2YAM6_CIOSA